MRKSLKIVELEQKNQSLLAEIESLNEKIRTGKTPKTNHWKPIENELKSLFIKENIKAYPLIDKLKVVLSPALGCHLNNTTKDSFYSLAMDITQVIIQHRFAIEEKRKNYNCNKA